MNKSFLIVLLIIICECSYSQTMHSLLFTNIKEPGREADRTAELQNMTTFCNDIANALGYKHNLRRHSDSEFTSTVMEREIESLNVREGDIVILYYAGHGCNWDDDDWPHMALNDRQYWETTAYSKLKSKTYNAKLTLCIASCCNMDSRGRDNLYSYSDGTIDKNKVRQLFTGFEGNLSIKASSSIRGQYTYSWSSGNRLGSIYSISFRDEIYAAITSQKNTPLRWESILEATKEQTLAHTNNKQLPQYQIERTNKKVTTPQPTVSVVNSTSPGAEIKATGIEHNIDANGTICMAIKVDFNTHFMNEQGGKVVAFFESPKGVPVKDKNGKYATKSGNVCTSENFGSHYQHSKFSEFKLLIPNEELHALSGTHTYYVQVYIFDNKTKKYITHGDYFSFDVTKK